MKIVTKLPTRIHFLGKFLLGSLSNENNVLFLKKKTVCKMYVYVFKSLIMSFLHAESLNVYIDFLGQYIVKRKRSFWAKFSMC